MILVLLKTTCAVRRRKVHRTVEIKIRRSEAGKAPHTVLHDRPADWEAGVELTEVVFLCHGGGWRHFFFFFEPSQRKDHFRQLDPASQSAGRS